MAYEKKPMSAPGPLKRPKAALMKSPYPKAQGALDKPDVPDRKPREVGRKGMVKGY